MNEHGQPPAPGLELAQKLETSVQYRDLLIAVSTAIYILLIQLEFVSFTPTFLGAIALLFLWNRLASALYRRRWRSLQIAWISGILDVAVCTLLVRDTGGTQSVLLPLYFVAVLGAARHVDARFGAALLLLAGLSLSAVALSDEFNLPAPASLTAGAEGSGSPLDDARYRGIAIGTLFAFLIPVLYSSAQLASKLRSREEALERANANLNVLYEIGRPLADSLSTERVAETIVNGLVRSFGMESAALYLSAGDGDLYCARRVPETVAGAGDEAEQMHSLRARMEEQTPRQEGRTVYMPIGTKARLLGILVAQLPPPGRALAPEELNTIRLLSGQVGIAVENARLYETTERLSRTDGLTHLYNHRFFQERIREEFKRSDRFGQTLSLLMIDVDDFKRINDTHGHQCGDQILQRIGRVLRASLREVDVAARYGGDEFAIILPDTDLREAVEVAERLRKAMEKHPFLADGTPVTMTLSLGAAARPPQSAVRTEELIKMADQALFEAKSRGRNAVSAHPGA